MNKILLLLGLPGVGLLGFAVAASEGLPPLSDLILPSIVILIAILVNGLFVSAEFAIIGVRPTQVEEMVKSGNQNAARVMKTLVSQDNQDQYIATAQLGITLSTLILGMYGEPAISHFIEPYMAVLLGYDPHDDLIVTLGYVVALSVLTYLHIVIGEMIPKQVALAGASRAVILLSKPMEFFQTIFKWPVWVLNSVGAGVLRLIQVPPAEGHERVRSTDELEQIVSDSVKGGFLREEEEEWIINIFNFSDREVQQVMTPRRKIEAIDKAMPNNEVLELVAKSRHSRFPVYENDLDHIAGILHMKELVRHQINKGKFDLDDLIHDCPSVPEHSSVEGLLNIFKKDRIHMAVVYDEFNGTAGIVTLEDLIEEVVGEVRDEFDREQEPFVEVAPGIFEVEGSYLIDDLVDDLKDLVEELEFDADHDLPDVDTTGGLIIAKLGRPPVEGDQVVYNDQVKFTVLAVDGLAVSRARVEYPTPGVVDEAE